MFRLSQLITNTTLYDPTNAPGVKGYFCLSIHMPLCDLSTFEPRMDQALFFLRQYCIVEFKASLQCNIFVNNVYLLIK